MHVRGADLSHDHIEARNQRFSDMRVQEVIEATKKHQQIWDDPDKEELEKALEDSLKMYDEHQMKMFAKERDQIHAAVLGNLQQGGGGSGRGAGGVAPKARRNSSASLSKSKKDSEGNDPPAPQRASPAPSKHERSQIPVAASIPDQETADTVQEEQPAARNMNLDRSRSPARSPSRQRRHRRRDADGKDGLRDPDVAQSGGAMPECTIRPAHTKVAFWIVQDPDPSAGVRSLDVAEIEQEVILKSGGSRRLEVAMAFGSISCMHVVLNNKSLYTNVKLA